MHNFLVRCNNVLLVGLAVALLLSFLSALSVMNHTPDVPIQILDHEVMYLGQVSFNRNRNSNTMYETFLSLDMDLDFRPVWNWNVGQIFMIVVAEYEYFGQPLHQVVIYDRVIQSYNDSLLSLRGELSKYPLVEKIDLRNKELKLSVHWDIMPTSGWTKRRGGPEHNAYHLKLGPDVFRGSYSKIHRSYHHQF
jgi:hypothetical protein